MLRLRLAIVIAAVTVATGFTPATGDITTNLIGHWPCQDNAASTVVVGSVGGNGTLQAGDNTSAKSDTGPTAEYPLALHINGSDDYISIPDFTASLGDSATFALWVKLDDATPAGESTTGFANLGALVTGRASHYPYNVDVKAYLNIFRATSNTTISRVNAITLPGGVSLDAWHHVCITTTTGSNNWIFYINGSSVTTATGITGVYYDSDLWSIGRSGDGTTSYWLDGTVAGIRLYSRALSAADVIELYTGEAPSPVSVYYYNQ
jgi:hypothetical protein